MAYKKIEQYDEDVTSGLMKNYKDVLGLIGEESDREGLQKTPERLAKAMQYLTQGYNLDARAIINSAKFHEPVSEMIVVKDIEIYSMCEHHMLPFFGKAHVAYIPNGWITGLSKLKWCPVDLSKDSHKSTLVASISLWSKDTIGTGFHTLASFLL